MTWTDFLLDRFTRMEGDKPMDKVCRTCDWYAQSESVCCNGDSDHRADFMNSEDSCPAWGNYDYEMYGEEET